MAEFVFLLRVLATAVLRAFFPAMLSEAKASLRDTAEEARPQPELKARLRQRVRAKWGRAGVAGMLLASVLLLGGLWNARGFYPGGGADPPSLPHPQGQGMGNGGGRRTGGGNLQVGVGLVCPF